jgi:hypothetical protein
MGVGSEPAQHFGFTAIIGAVVLQAETVMSPGGIEKPMVTSASLVDERKALLGELSITELLPEMYGPRRTAGMVAPHVDPKLLHAQMYLYSREKMPKFDAE